VKPFIPFPFIGFSFLAMQLSDCRNVSLGFLTLIMLTVLDVSLPQNNLTIVFLVKTLKHCATYI